MSSKTTHDNSAKLTDESIANWKVTAYLSVVTVAISSFSTHCSQQASYCQLLDYSMTQLTVSAICIEDPDKTVTSLMFSKYM